MTLVGQGLTLAPLMRLRSSACATTGRLRQETMRLIQRDLDLEEARLPT